MDPVLSLGALGALFVVSHLVLSHPPVRDRLIGATGRMFPALYSLVALAIWVPLVGIWWTNRHAGALLWAFRGPVAVHTAELLSVLGVALVLGGVASPAPTSIARGGRGGAEVRGMSAITRHPVFVGIALWSLGHLLVNGWAGDVAFYGSHLALALLGAAHQDARHRAARPEYAGFLAQTTFLPVPRRLSAVGRRAWLGAGAGVVLAVLLRLLHRWF